MPVNVLFIIWSLEKGGAERFLVSLVKYLDKNKIKPIVCCLNWKGEWAKELEDRGIKVIALNKKGKFDIAVIFSLIRVIRQYDISIVNTHLWAADALGRMAAILAGVPVIVSTIHSLDLWKKWWHMVIDKLLSYRTNMFIAVSESAKNHYINTEKIALSKVAYIPNAIEIEKFKNNEDCSYLYYELELKKEESIILACIGRLNEEKGHKYLLEALSSLNGRYNIKLLVVGEGPLRNSLQSMVHSLQLNDKIKFLGQRNDIPQILEISDCLILSSIYEGLPSCILEAMAAGKPVIATKVGGIPDLIVEEETGFMVPSQDSHALALAIEKLINLPDKGKKMGINGREIANDNFSIALIAKHTEELFLKLAENNEVEISQ